LDQTAEERSFRPGHIQVRDREGFTQLGNRVIDGWYNTRRIQKRLGWLSPDEYEAKYYANQATAKPVTTEPPTPALTS
ncbi:hypothetical protein ACWGJO_41270, partial [Kitasatospora sp. NPDC054795]